MMSLNKIRSSVWRAALERAIQKNIGIVVTGHPLLPTLYTTGSGEQFRIWSTLVSSSRAGHPAYTPCLVQEVVTGKLAGECSCEAHTLGRPELCTHLTLLVYAAGFLDNLDRHPKKEKHRVAA